MSTKNLPYEVVFSDGTYVIVTALNAAAIAYDYNRKYNSLPVEHIIDVYNVPCHYHKSKE